MKSNLKARQNKSLSNACALSIDLLFTLAVRLYSGQVTLGVTVESVSGLKSAALALTRKHPCLDYYSTLGVNFYVNLMLSFQGPSVSVMVVLSFPSFKSFSAE